MAENKSKAAVQAAADASVKEQAEKGKKEKYVPDYNVEYTEEELNAYWGDSCSGE